MNKHRRSEIKSAVELLDRAKEMLDDVRDDEEFAFDSLPDNFQNSERGETMQENIDSIDEAVEKIDEAKDLIEEAMDLVRYL